MRPVLSTRIFGRAPGPRQLALVRHLGLMDLAPDLDQLSDARAQARLLKTALEAAGVRVPAVHLPRAELAEGPLRQAFEDVRTLGANLAIAHCGPRDEAWCGRLLNVASEYGVSVALEIEGAPGATAASLCALLQREGCPPGHGLCLDTSRWRPAAGAVAAIAGRLRWIEVSGRPDAPRHVMPAPDDRALHDLVANVRLPTVCYEIVPVGPPGVAPGDAQLSQLLSGIHAWHRGGLISDYAHGPIPPV